jgi:acyl carrier protein
MSQAHDNTGSAPDVAMRQALEVEVLDVVRALAAEVRTAGGSAPVVTPASRFDRDLGLDSLARAELMLRIERRFAVELPESALAEAETPRDLVRQVSARGAVGSVSRRAERAAKISGEVAPAHGAKTLNAVLDWHAERTPEQTHIILVEGDGAEVPISFGDLAGAARALAGGLVEAGIEPGQRVALMLPTGRDYYEAFFAILYAGGVPVPIYPPVRLSQIEDHLRRQILILNNCQASMLITVPEARRVSDFLMSQVPSLVGVEPAAGIARRPGALLPAEPAPESLAMLQYTSGSTGDPKGVMLSHANLLANIRAMGQVLDVKPDDVFVSWLPLYHDMGLIGAWLGTMYYAVPVVMMSPLTFLVRPQAWLWAIHRHRGTLSGGPNFAFDLCVKRIDDADIEGLDLSSLRMVVNGAEPVQPRTIRAFTERFRLYGFRPEALAPVYGLAENAVGLAFPPVGGRLPPIDRVSRRALQRDGIARPARADEENPLEIPACGRPLPGHEIRVIDEAGREVAERRQGRLQFRGPSATKGYYQNEAKTRELRDGDWLNSGDLAYVADGDLYITGRSKDMIIRAGRNIYPQEIEAAVSEIEGIRKGCVAAFASADPEAGVERLVVLAETRERADAAKSVLRDAVDQVVLDLTEAKADDVVLAPPNAVPKTSSGKIRRDAARQLYEAGRIGAAERALWWQLTRLAVIGWLERMRRGVRLAGAIAYSIYWWSLLVAAACVTWPLVLLLPGPRVCWALVHAVVRGLLRLMAIPIEVEGQQRLQAFEGVVLFNHTSYADSLVLAALLRGPLAVVAKKELGRQLVPHLFLRKLDTIYVDRADPDGARKDAERARRAVEAGERVIFFPEGTLRRMPGLLPFKMGAFSIAATAGVPVLPVGLRGVRTILRDGQWFARRGTIAVRVGEPLHPAGSDFHAAVALRAEARRQMLALTGEPDLAYEIVGAKSDAEEE